MSGPREFHTEPGQLDDIAIPAVFRTPRVPSLGEGASIETAEADARPANVRGTGPVPRLFVTLAFFDVDEDLPDADATVHVLLDDDEQTVTKGYFDGNAWCSPDGSEFEHRVTHWAEDQLPTPHRGG